MIDTYKTRGARKKLIEEIRSKGIIDENVLRAMNTVPRHFFLHQDFISHAYEDKAFRIDEGQTISQPYTVAYQTQLLNIQKGDKVLEIGTGSGYQASILLEMGAIVTSIERSKILHQKSAQLLKKLNYNATFIYGDGTLGYPANAPYDKIIVTAGAPKLPDALKEQLKISGLMVIPVGDDKVQTMHIIIRKSTKDFEDIAMDKFRFVPLIGSQGWELK